MRYVKLCIAAGLILAVAGMARASTAGYFNVSWGGPGLGDSDAWYVSYAGHNYDNYRGEGCYDGFQWQIKNESPGPISDVLWVPEFVNVSETNTPGSFYALPYVGGGVWTRTFAADEGSDGYKGKTVTMTVGGQDRWEYLDPSIPQLSPSDFKVNWSNYLANPNDDNTINYDEAYPVFEYGDMAAGETKWQKSSMSGSLTIGGSEDTGQHVRFEGDHIAIPEPLTMLGVFAGIAGIGGYLRKRSRP